jgi:hypothetical protein
MHAMCKVIAAAFASLQRTASSATVHLISVYTAHSAHYLHEVLLLLLLQCLQYIMQRCAVSANSSCCSWPRVSVSSVGAEAAVY